MTRINCVNVEELTNLHLLAEYRELPRVFTLAAKAQQEKWKGLTVVPVPEHYVLGEGHVTFFYNKLLWCWLRWLALRDELILRGYKCDPALRESIKESTVGLAVDQRLWNDWDPPEYSKWINRIRIRERLDEYYGKLSKRIS